MTEEIDWTGVIFGMGVLILGTIILVVVLVVAERFYRARAQRQDMDRLVSLVQRYEQTTESTERHQQTAAAELTDVRTRLDSIERLLREVE
jgi:Tfp pilus assembly protein PilO